MNAKRSFGALVLVMLGVVAVAEPARAQGVYDSGGFEPPRFSTGNLAGQDTVLGPWLKDSGTATGVVQTATVQGGTQAVQVTRPADEDGDTRFAVVKPVTPTPLQLIRVSWDMNVTRTQIPGMPFGPFFGVEGYDGSGDDFPLLIGSLGVDATTGDVLYQDENGFFAEPETRTIVPFGQWNRYMIEMDFAAQEYTAYLNGTPLVTSPFVDRDLGITRFTDAPIATLAATLESLSIATGTAYFDNYTIEIVPEPASMAIIGLASLGMLRRRRTVSR
jgi:hypothetical protein